MLLRYFSVILLSVSALAQTAPKRQSGPAKTAATAKSSSAKAANGTLTPQKKFVLDAVKSAVALPQADPQDRLRVLTSAVEVISPIDSAYAKQLAAEGMQIERNLLMTGQTPAVSILATGRVDCNAVGEFVQSLPVTAIASAEQSLINAMTFCPKQAGEPGRLRLDEALSRGVVAPRAMQAAMDAAGAKSPWSQSAFERLFASLPRDYEKRAAEAPTFAQVYARMAAEVPKDAARNAGLELLEWLSHLPEGGERNMAVNQATDAMRSALGDEKYREALESNMAAADIAKTAGQPGAVATAPEDTTSVLQAMSKGKEDRSDELQQMPPAQRAREAAAAAFAANGAHDRKLADHYLDIAFSAVEDVWSHRSDESAAVAIVQEVSDAAAQVDPVAALGRAQRLRESAEQAIAMLTVARVVGARQ